MIVKPVWTFGVTVPPSRAFDHGGFAGAVVADEGDHLAGVDVEGCVVECADVAEAARQTAGFQEWCRWVTSADDRRDKGRTAGERPIGKPLRQDLIVTALRCVFSVTSLLRRNARVRVANSWYR